jgi:hypothetical protein
MVQLHPEDDYKVVVEVEAIDLIIATMKAQARARACDSKKTLQLDILNIQGIKNKS